MPTISETIARLSKLRAGTGSAIDPDDAALSELTGFGSNPGALRGWM